MICNKSQASSTCLGVIRATLKREESLLVISPSDSNLCKACLMGVLEIPNWVANLFSLMGALVGSLKEVIASTK